jgi:hypothetical protein
MLEQERSQAQGRDTDRLCGPRALEVRPCTRG